MLKNHGGVAWLEKTDWAWFSGTMSFDARILGGMGVFVAAVEAGSFGRAGIALGLTQSGVSRAIARLEERVGARLFHRGARALSLTEEGKRFYDQALPLLLALEDAANDAGSGTTAPRGTLRVVIDALSARMLVAPGLAQFLAKHRELSLELVIQDSVSDLADGFEVGMRFGPPEPSSLITRKLLETRVVTCASRQYLERHGRPQTPKDLTKHECILFRDPRSGRPFEWIFQRREETLTVPVSGRLCVNDSATQLAACAAGHGIAQPLELVLQGRKHPNLVRLFPKWSDERYPLYVYYPSRNLPSARVRAFVDFIAAAGSAAVSRPPRDA